MYNVVLISTAQPSDSSVCVCHTHFFVFFSTIVYPRILNIVPCAKE